MGKRFDRRERALIYTSMPPEIPGYEGLAEIGHGGFAVVYRAHDDRFNRSVAIKVLTGPLDAASRRRAVPSELCSPPSG